MFRTGSRSWLLTVRRTAYTFNSAQPYVMRQYGVTDASYSGGFRAILYGSSGSFLTAQLKENAGNSTAPNVSESAPAPATLELAMPAFATCACLQGMECHQIPPRLNQSLLLPASFTAERYVPYYCNATVDVVQNGTAGHPLEPQAVASKNIPTDKNWYESPTAHGVRSGGGA